MLFRSPFPRTVGHPRFSFSLHSSSDSLFSLLLDCTLSISTVGPTPLPRGRLTPLFLISHFSFHFLYPNTHTTAGNPPHSSCLFIYLFIFSISPPNAPTRALIFLLHFFLLSPLPHSHTTRASHFFIPIFIFSISPNSHGMTPTPLHLHFLLPLFIYFLFIFIFLLLLYFIFIFQKPLNPHCHR